MSLRTRRSVVWWTAVLVIVGLVATVEVEPRWIWDYYTSWNLIVVYAACAVALVSPASPNAALLADVASVSSWSTAILYTAAVSLSPELSRINDPGVAMYWLSSSILHYVLPLLLVFAFKTDTGHHYRALGIVESMLVFYLLTHDAATLYHVDAPTLLIYTGPLAAAVISFCLFLNWEYLSAHSLAW